MHAPNLHRTCQRAASVKTLVLVLVTVAGLISVASYSTHRSVCTLCTAADARALADS